MEADQILEALADDLMEYGDLRWAMRNLMSRGMQMPQGGYMQGLRDMLKQLRERKRERLEQYDLSGIFDEFREHEDLPNTTNPDDWARIARAIGDRYDDFDGFVLLHGTDTMAYTSSALPFMLQGIQKPVIITGAQIPLCEVRNDARDNLTTSLIVAGMGDIPEVCVYFDGRLLRGNRAVNAAANNPLPFFTG